METETTEKKPKLLGDMKILNKYLKEVKKRSMGAWRNQDSAIKKFLEYRVKDFKDITTIDVIEYFDEIIDEMDLKLSSKETYRSYLQSFFYYVQAIYLSVGINFVNPVPIKKIYSFTKKENDFEKISKINGKIFTNEELLEILEISKKQDQKYRDFIVFGILISSGMRISEALTTKVENIDLDERTIQTGFIKDARKSNKTLLFFFRERFKPYLKRYIQYLNDKSEWLFPGQKEYLNSSSFRDYVGIKYGKKYRKFHKFRGTLITNYKKNGCSLDDREILMNHKPTSMQGGHYVKLSISERRDLYDKYFPYKDFPYF